MKVITEGAASSTIASAPGARTVMVLVAGSRSRLFPRLSRTATTVPWQTVT